MQISDDLRAQAAEWQARGKDPSVFMARLLLRGMADAGLGLMSGILAGAMTAGERLSKAGSAAMALAGEHE